ncbi:hypothetical protein REPUB_Repub05bG0108600 [Reevesia pubescens]
MEVAASVALAKSGSLPMPLPSRNEWRAVFDHHAVRNPGEEVELDRPKLGQSYERTIYKVSMEESLLMLTSVQAELLQELNDNHLKGHIPPELRKHTELNIANNKLEGPIPDNLSSCTNLNSLNVHGNKLNGTVPLAFERLESMTYL